MPINYVISKASGQQWAVSSYIWEESEVINRISTARGWLAHPSPMLFKGLYQENNNENLQKLKTIPTSVPASTWGMSPLKHGRLAIDQDTISREPFV